MEVLTKLSLILMLVMPLVSGQLEQEQEPSIKPPRPASQCNCPIRHPQEKICRADIVIQGRIMGVKSPGNGLPLEGGLLEFSVKVSKIFKDTEDVLTRRRRVAMITSNSARQCGITEMKRGALYLMTGLVIDGEVYFSQCEWVHRFKELSPDQKEGLKEAFISGCNSCQIDQQGSSIPGIHNITASTKACYHDPLGSTQLQVEDCETEYSICKPVNEEGPCDWTRGQRYEKCVDKRIKKFNEARRAARLEKLGGRS